MRRLPRRIVFVFTALLLGADPAPLKDDTGVYALIDRVVFEPENGEPERVQLWGSFAVARSFTIENGDILGIDFGRYDYGRGYMYYTADPATVAPASGAPYPHVDRIAQDVDDR